MCSKCRVQINVVISLEGSLYQNNILEDIGENHTARFCAADKTACCRQPYMGSVIGNWFASMKLKFLYARVITLYETLISLIRISCICMTSPPPYSIPPSHSSSSAVDPPMIIKHPQDMFNVTPGTNAIFTVVAIGLRLNYTWTEGDGKPLSSNRRYVTVNGTLTIPIVEQSDTGSYRCLVTNEAGNATSRSANLTLSKLCACTVKPHRNDLSNT